MSACLCNCGGGAGPSGTGEAVAAVRSMEQPERPLISPAMERIYKAYVR